MTNLEKNTLIPQLLSIVGIIDLLNFNFISAGLGRTGTFIAIYNLIRCLSEINKFNSNRENGSKINGFFSVFNEVRKLREQRMGMVSTISQYKYIYEFCLEFLKRNFS